ncbi:MAG: hypothetical protein ACR65R_20465 [Methylomicrobium sp.]
MSNKAIFASLLMISSAVMAEQSLLEGVAKQTAKNTAAAVAPEPWNAPKLPIKL